MLLFPSNDQIFSGNFVLHWRVKQKPPTNSPKSSQSFWQSHLSAVWKGGICYSPQLLAHWFTPLIHAAFMSYQSYCKYHLLTCSLYTCQHATERLWFLEKLWYICLCSWRSQSWLASCYHGHHGNSLVRFNIAGPRLVGVAPLKLWLCWKYNRKATVVSVL